MNIKMKKLATITILFFSLMVGGCENKEDNPSVSDKTEMYLVKKDGKMGIIDKKGKVLIEPKYEELSFNPKETKGTLIKAKSEEKYGFINLKGKWVINPKYDNCGLFSNGLASVLINGRVGFIDTNGKLVIDPNFDVFPKARYGDYHNIYTFNDCGLCIVQNNGRFGVIDKKGEFIIEPKYDEEFTFSSCNELIPVKQGGLWGYIDKTGKEIIGFKYRFASRFIDGVALINDGKDRFIDLTGQELFDRDFQFSGHFKDGTALIDFNKIIDKKGNVVLDSNKEYIIKDNISEGLVVVWFKNSEKYGFVDKDGKQIIEGKYFLAHSFNNGYAIVINKDNNGDIKQGFIDKNGKEVINLQYDYTDSFDGNGIAKVYICDDTEYKKLSFREQVEYVLKNGRVGYIDITGKYIWEPTK